jgi:hypothetical protein
MSTMKEMIRDLVIVSAIGGLLSGWVISKVLGLG